MITFVSAFLGPSLSLRYLLSMTPAFSRALLTESTSARDSISSEAGLRFRRLAMTRRQLSI